MRLPRTRANGGTGRGTDSGAAEAPSATATATDSGSAQVAGAAPEDNRGRRLFGRDVPRAVAVALVYYGGAQIGLLLELVREQVTPLWPPTGIALAALLLLGVRVWPGILLGALLVNLLLGPSLLVVAAIAAGNTAAPLFAYWLLRRVGFHVELNRLRDAIALVFLGAFAGMLVSSAAGAGVLTLSGAVGARAFWATWSVWWTGDAVGVLVFVPLLLLLRSLRPIPRPVRAHRWAEATALLAGTLSVTVVATRNSFDLLFLVFPFLIWAALRFQLAGAAPCALIVSTVATIGAAQGTGPFAGHDLFTNMVTLQAFNGSSALTALVLSATITERNETHEHIERLCSQLSEVVTRLEPGRTGKRPWTP